MTVKICSVRGSFWLATVGVVLEGGRFDWSTADAALLKLR